MDPKIAAFLSEQAIAVVGVSRKRGFGNGAARALRRAGYRVFLVNEHADAIDGEKCFRSLVAIPEPFGAALVVVPPARSARVVQECAALGVRKVWLQQGAESAEAIAAADEAGIACVARECILMYAQPRGIHRLHRWIRERRDARDLARP